MLEFHRMRLMGAPKDGPLGWVIGGVAVLVLTSDSPHAFASDPLFRLEARVTPAIIADGRVFTANVTIRNTSQDEQSLQTTQCTYGDWNWKSDQAPLRVEYHPGAACEKNRVVYVRLKPGDAFNEALPILPTLPAATKSLTFRLGFDPRLGSGTSVQTLPSVWSNSVTVSVTK